MQKILISIKPEWVEKILNGEKTIEIRKTMPKGYEPCEVYIYCTKGKPNGYLTKCPQGICQDYWIYMYDYNRTVGSWGCNILNGKVVAKFTLKTNDYIVYWVIFGKPHYDIETLDRVLKKSCLTKNEIEDYGKGKNLYAWYIDDLEIFDEPKELKDFGLTKAPQSWCYIKEEKR